MGRNAPDGLVDLYPPALVADLPRPETHAAAIQERDEGSTLALIGRRQKRSHNSWMHNQPLLDQPAANNALMHPHDAEPRGIEDGARIEVASSQGSIELEVQLTTDVMPGVVVVPHGWGSRTDMLSRASALGGADINRVIPGGSAHVEPVSGQVIMVGHAVHVRRVDATPDVRDLA